jgi:hypothetical protein
MVLMMKNEPLSTQILDHKKTTNIITKTKGIV